MGYIRVSLRRTSNARGSTRQARISMLQSTLSPEDNDDMLLMIHALSARGDTQSEHDTVFDYEFPISL